MVETMAARWIDIPTSDGGRFKGELAIPAAGAGPGILILQEIFGCDPNLKFMLFWGRDTRLLESKTGCK
jgi:carboxymethylenebutenolidase